jgi:hypothetical protein
VGRPGSVLAAPPAAFRNPQVRVPVGTRTDALTSGNEVFNSPHVPRPRGFNALNSQDTAYSSN